MLSCALLNSWLVAVQGHPPPEEELEMGYGDEQDAMVEYMNDGYDQDLLDEEGLEGEEYPEGLLEGRPCCLCQSPCQSPVAIEGVTELATRLW